MSITQHTMSRRTFCDLHDQYRERLLNSGSICKTPRVGTG